MCFEFLAQVFFFIFFFFFQAEDGIRDADVTGVQTLCSSDLVKNSRFLLLDPAHYLFIWPLRILEYLAIRLGMLSEEPVNQLVRRMLRKSPPMGDRKSVV